jgi:hypothetical protein
MNAAALLAAAGDRLDAELEYVLDTPVGGHRVSGRRALAELLDCPRSTRAIVASHRDTLRRVSGRRTFRGILRWVDRVRPVLLSELAGDVNHAADSQGAVADYVVVDSRMVASERVAPMLAPAAATLVDQPARTATAGRSRRAARRRRAGRGRARSPGRPSDDEHDLARHVGRSGAEAAA